MDGKFVSYLRVSTDKQGKSGSAWMRNVRRSNAT